MALLVDPLGAAAQDPDPEGPSNAQNLEGWHLEDHRVAGTIFLSWWRGFQSACLVCRDEGQSDLDVLRCA